MINAKPQNNGNSAADFAAAHKSLMEAEAQMAEAIALLNTDVFHGRNYQHKDQPLDARSDDLAKLDDLRDAYCTLYRMRQNVMQAILGSDDAI